MGKTVSLIGRLKQRIEKQAWCPKKRSYYSTAEDKWKFIVAEYPLPKYW